MRRLSLVIWAGVLFVASAESRGGDRLFATHCSIWGSSKITELDPQTGAVLNSYAPPASPNQNAGLAFDGSHLYYLPGPSAVYSTVYKLNPDTGAVVGQYHLPDNPYRSGLATMGDCLYTNDWRSSHNDIEVYDLATGAFVRAIDFHKANPAESNLMIDADLGEFGPRNRLLAIAHPVGSFAQTQILGLDPLTGVIRDRFSMEDADAVYAAKGLAAIGEETYVSLHVSRDYKQVIVYGRDGTEHRRFGIAGSTGIQALASTHAVPEPASVMALAAGLVMLWGRRRR
ncbi:MAG: PEP-CTERM sorting domain-containing protein [Phycisphaerae bacterium]|nr:PEP-CTERM sorting domain-containing protein [Phycisphaerae bacterium]